MTEESNITPIRFCAVPRAKGTTQMTVNTGTWESLAVRILDDSTTNKDGPGIVPVIPFEDAVDGMGRVPRRSASVASVTMLALDIDGADLSAEDIDESVPSKVVGWLLNRLGSASMGLEISPTLVAYTTSSHGVREIDGKEKWVPGRPRFRAFIPYSRPITPDEHARIMLHLASHIPGMDPQCKDVARIMYTARARHPDAECEPWAFRVDTAPLDPAVLLNACPKQTKAAANDDVPGVVVRHDSEAIVREQLDVIERAIEAVKDPHTDTLDLIDVVLDPAVAVACATVEQTGDPRPAARLMAVVKGRKGLTCLTSLRGAIKTAETLDLSGPKRLTSQRGKGGASVALTPEALAEALDHVDGGERDTWLRMGMALMDYAREAHITRGDAARIFATWSRTQTGFVSDDDCIKTLRSLKGRGVTIGSLIHAAREGGWTPPRGSAEVTGRASDGLSYGSHAEVARALVAHITEDAPLELRGARGTPAARVSVEVPDRPTVVHVGGEIMHWDRRERLWQRWDVFDTQALVATAFDGCPVGEDGSPWRASGSAASGVHTFAHALVRDAVSLEALAPPAEVAGAVAVDGGTLVMDTSGRVVLMQDHPVWGQRHRIPAPFNPKLIRGACHWGAFLDSIFEGAEDAEDRKATLQEYVGATLFGIADALQRVLLVLGEGSNGKGVLMRAIKRLFPEDAVCSIPPQLMRGGSNAGLHTLLDARLNLCGDVDREALLETGLLKQLTGGDRVSFDVKYAPERRSGVATCGHIWSLNRLPATRDQSTGFWRRWAIVPFEQTFTGREDFNLNDKLKTDLPVILAWAVEGAQRLVRNGMVLTMGASHDAAISEWKGETDSGRAFAEVARRPNERETITKVYQAYTAWCERSGRKALSRPHLRDRLDALAKEGAIERVNLSGTIHYGLTASIWEIEEPEVEAEAEPAPPLDFITLLDATTTH